MARGVSAPTTCPGACAEQHAAHKAEVRRNNLTNARHRRRERGEPNTTTVRERLSRRAIFDRDGWACYLCATPLTPPSRTWAPTMATLDHVVPLAKGGRHVEANLRSCCARCNSEKADRLVPVVA